MAWVKMTGFAIDGGGDAMVTTEANAKAYGQYSHCESQGTANGKYSHAEGSSTATGEASHAEGYGCESSGDYSHAEGYGCVASGNYSHAEGENSTAGGAASYASLWGGTANGIYSTSYGGTNANGSYSTAVFGGYAYAGETSAYGTISATTTNGTCFNVNGNNYNSTGLLRFMNCFVINAGTSFIWGACHQTGADYAEMFEWADGNPNDEDRVGLFVTLCNGNKIRIANSGDTPIGVVSATPAVIGDNDNDIWKNQYLTDEYGRLIPKIYTETTDDGTKIEYESFELNPEYDSSRTYLTRDERPEWDAVGFMGKFIVNDDGSCVVGEKCTVGDNGIATAGNDYYVINRIDETTVKILACFA